MFLPPDKKKIWFETSVFCNLVTFGQDQNHTMAASYRPSCWCSKGVLFKYITSRSLKYISNTNILMVHVFSWAVFYYDYYELTKI